jgi:hypothetical protein
MRDLLWRRPVPIVMLGVLLAGSILPTPAHAGKLSWLDDVVRDVVRETEAGSRAAVRGAEGVSARAAGRLFVREADESLEVLAKRSDALARLGRRFEEPSEALLEARFNRLLRPDPETSRTFRSLAPAEKRLVVEMGETAQRLARRYPGQAERMIRNLGTEGMSAVRVYGDDVAEVIAKEGPETIGILRKTGRSGWNFFTQQVLPHKKKLLAAGVLAAFLANPEKFVDYAGRATEYAVREFGRAGIQLAGGAVRGLDGALTRTLADYGLTSETARYVGMSLAGFVAIVATMVLIGLPVRWIFRPFGMVFGLLRNKRPMARRVS